MHKNLSTVTMYLTGEKKSKIFLEHSNIEYTNQMYILTASKQPYY